MKKDAICDYERGFIFLREEAKKMATMDLKIEPGEIIQVCKNCGYPFKDYLSYKGSLCICDNKKPDIKETLKARGERYGKFTTHAHLAQSLKHVMQCTAPGWDGLAWDQKEALEMIAHKIARIINGDPNYHDSWHDIIGYAQLIANRLKPESP